MGRRFWKLTLLTAAAVVGGCKAAGSDAVPSTLPGSYVYAAAGSTLKKPWEFAARLDLRPDHTYTFTLDKTMDGKKDPRETSVGTFAVTGDELSISDSEDKEGATKDIHKLRIKADSLIAEVGWTASLVLKGVGAPNVVFVKQSR